MEKIPLKDVVVYQEIKNLIEHTKKENNPALERHAEMIKRQFEALRKAIQ